MFGVMGVGCPIRFVTGIPCPGCGMTRAWLSLLSGNEAAAFAFHSLFLLAPVSVALALAESTVSTLLLRRAFGPFISIRIIMTNMNALACAYNVMVSMN